MIIVNKGDIEIHGAAIRLIAEWCTLTEILIRKGVFIDIEHVESYIKDIKDIMENGYNEELE